MLSDKDLSLPGPPREGAITSALPDSPRDLTLHATRPGDGTGDFFQRAQSLDHQRGQERARVLPLENAPLMDELSAISRRYARFLPGSAPMQQKPRGEAPELAADSSEPALEKRAGSPRRSRQRERIEYIMTGADPDGTAEAAELVAGHQPPSPLTGRGASSGEVVAPLGVVGGDDATAARTDNEASIKGLGCSSSSLPLLPPSFLLHRR